MATDPSRPKRRSPSYPGIGLENALQRAQQLWDLAGKHPAPYTAAMSAFGYGPKSSGGLLALAALKKFGLAEDEGSREARHVKLTKLGQELLLHGTDRDSEAWKTRIQEAALAPTVYQELWRKYGPDLPPDDRVMKAYLVYERGFNDSAAAELLRNFRSTLAFANVTGVDGTVSPNDEDNDEDEEGLLTPPPALDAPALDPPVKREKIPEQKAEQRTVQVLYSPDDWALLQGRFPMSEREWEAFLETLQNMKRGLVKPASD